MKDFLREIIDERTARNPEFPRLVAEAAERRVLARSLTSLREKQFVPDPSGGPHGDLGPGGEQT
jgi:hypothetical protein